MLRTAELLPLTGLSTLGFDPARFPAEPPACYRASWQLLGRDSHPLATTSLCWINSHQAPPTLGARTIEVKTIFPACYSGRWPHIHLEVYSSVAKAVSNGPIVKTSQIALPRAACKKVDATRGYPGSSSSLTRTSLSTDNVFSDDRA